MHTRNSFKIRSKQEKKSQIGINIPTHTIASKHLQNKKKKSLIDLNFSHTQQFRKKIKTKKKITNWHKALHKQHFKAPSKSEKKNHKLTSIMHTYNNFKRRSK